jgi:hypothetical protein
VASFLHETEEFLWPAARHSRASGGGSGEILASYPYRSDVSTSAWWDLIDRAQHHIDLLGYTLYFLPLDNPRLIQTLANKCANGCRVRAAIASPESRHVADRDTEEGLALTLAVRIKTSLQYFAPLMGCDGFELRYQDVPLYNSVFRFDEDMFVTPHLYATPGASAPLLHLRRLGPDGLFTRFATHFEAIWATTTPTPDHTSPTERPSS